MSPSLGWLQAFLCAAEYLDYERAANDLGIGAGRVKRRVEKLEEWLHKLLIMDQPIELNEGDGAQFIPVAREVLKRFAATCADLDTSITGLNPTPRAKLMSAVRLHDLERFICLAQEGTFKRAADTHGCDVSTLHRSIKDLEKATGRRLAEGRVTVRLTDAGEKFEETALSIVESLTEFRAVIPDDYDPLKEKVRAIYELIKRRQAELLTMAGLIERTGRAQRGKVRLADVNRQLEFITGKIEKIEEVVPSLRRPSTSVVLDGAASINLESKVGK